MNGVSKISVTEDVCLISFNNVPRDLSVTSQIMTEFAVQDINIDMISQSAPIGESANVSFTVQSEDLVRALAIIQLFREQHPSVRPIVSSGNCKVQLYGEEMRSMPGVAARAFSVVSSITNEIMLITTSEVDISILIAQHELSSVLEALKQHYGI